jgi:glycosyltransferase involved in cell wall biosynthesis
MPAIRPPISAVLITQDAAEQLEACLTSLAFCDEILVVDSGSRDDTAELAARLGARVIKQDWLGFGRQKQFAVDHAAHDWVLCLDADERISPPLRASIESALVAPASPAYRFARRNRFMGRYLRHGEGYPDLSLRLFDRRRARWSDDAVHEKVLTDASPVTLPGDLLHDSAESMARYLAKQERYTTLAAERAVAAGKRASIAHMMMSPLLRFFKFYFARLGFLDGRPGLVHILIGCRNSYRKYAKMRALQAERT